MPGASSDGFQTTVLPHRSAGMSFQRRHGDREVAGRDHADDAERPPVREELLVRQLARHRLPVQAPALALEELGRVDGLLHAAARLAQGLADLARDEARERLLSSRRAGAASSAITCARCGAGTRAQRVKALRADSQASRTSSPVAFGATVTMSSRFAGFRRENPAPSPRTSFPPRLWAAISVLGNPSDCAFSCMSAA